MIPGDMLTEAQRRCIPDVSFELIPIRNLVSNQDYQRPLSENHIRKALEEFDVYQINPVKVSRRDGVNYVFDGQHTIEIIASESGSRDTPVWCMIYDDLKYKEEAHIFADQQKHVKALSSFETFKAHIEADDPKQKMIEAIVQSYGLEITSTKAKTASVLFLHWSVSMTNTGRLFWTERSVWQRLHGRERTTLSPAAS